jgi:hypothetical protein
MVDTVNAEPKYNGQHVIQGGATGMRLHVPIVSELISNATSQAHLWVDGNCSSLALLIHCFNQHGGFLIEDKGVTVDRTLIQPSRCNTPVLAPAVDGKFIPPPVRSVRKHANHRSL